MSILKNISLEYKSTAFFGIAALFLSFLSGIAAGINGVTVVLRALLISLFFSILGFMIVVVIKRFVPEIYQFISQFSGGPSMDVNIDDEDEEENLKEDHASAEAVAQDYSEGPKESIKDEIPNIEAADMGSRGEEFSEFRETDYDRMESHLSLDEKETVPGVKSPQVPQGGLGTAPLGSKKMGKHIIVEDDLVRYEPKIMAEAVRTMMRKDD